MADPGGKQWRAGGASAIGSAHLRRNTPNQDAWYASPQSQPGTRFMIAVADGHGSNRHFRSQSGAELAISAFQQAVEWVLDDPQELRGLGEDIVTLWRRLVVQHINANPYAENYSFDPYEPYGTTLVGVAGNAHFCLALQIGDGDLLWGYADGSVTRALPADEGLHGEQTYSLCMADAQSHLRIRVLGSGEAWPDFALVATDGVSKSFVDDATFTKTVQHYRELVSGQAELQATLQALPDWLRQVSDAGSGDDATLCLASSRFTA